MPARKKKVTSAADRSKRKATKPVSSDKGRKARARVSTATVSSSEGRQSTGSARVTGGTRRGAAAKSSGRQPRAITNGRSATMRQIRAKAVQARRMAQGKSTVASRQQGITPESARGQRIKAMASRQRVIGDSGQVRAAQQRGAAEAAKAQTRRNARAASQNMSRTIQNAKVGRSFGGKLLGRAAVPLAMVQEVQAMMDRDKRWNEAKAKMKAAKAKKEAAKKGNTSKFAGARDAAVRKAQTIKGSPVRGPKKSSAQQFDAAFKKARESGAKTFTWRGKKYTTEMK